MSETSQDSNEKMVGSYTSQDGVCAAGSSEADFFISRRGEVRLDLFSEVRGEVRGETRDRGFRGFRGFRGEVRFPR